jgi:hypothetical protein
MARIPMAKKYNTALRMVHSRAEKALCGWPFVASRDFWLMKLKCTNHKGHERAQRNDAQSGSKFAQESRRAGVMQSADHQIRLLHSGSRLTKPMQRNTGRSRPGLSAEKTLAKRKIEVSRDGARPDSNCG